MTRPKITGAFRFPRPGLLLPALLLLLFSGAGPAAAWEQALAPHSFNFPADHGSHPGYQTEWWYLTGQLRSADGREFGYQFTIFRQGVNEEVGLNPANPWEIRDLYILHTAVSDIAAQKFHQHQDISRAGPGLAGAAVGRLETWLKGSRLTFNQASGELDLTATTPGFSLELTIKPGYPPILNGDQGLSAKGPRPGQASQYYSWPQLESRGRLKLADTTLDVDGRSWLDREFATNQLGPEQAGWDWFALNFADGTAVMLYRMRLQNGGQDPASSGNLGLCRRQQSPP